MNITATPDKNGVLIYTLPAGTPLFRGAKEQHANYLRGADIKFFALNAAEATEYGTVNSFRTTRALRLVALDQPNDVFYDAAGNAKVDVKERDDGRRRRGDSKRVGRQSVQELLTKFYGFKKKTQTRYSYNPVDSAIARYICNLGYDGYALIQRMKTDFGGKFHQEVAICAPSNVTEHTDDLRSPSLVAAAATTAAAATPASAEQVPVISSLVPDPALKGVKSNLFGDLSPEAASPPPQTRRRKTPSPPQRKTRRALFDRSPSPRRGGRRGRRRGGALKNAV